MNIGYLLGQLIGDVTGQSVLFERPGQEADISPHHCDERAGWMFDPGARVEVSNATADHAEGQMGMTAGDVGD